MNFKIVQSFFPTSYFLKIIILLGLSSCYTQVNLSSLEKSNFNSESSSYKSEVIDPNILGTWQREIHPMDTPKQVKKLIFDSNQNFLFDEDIARVNRNTLSGSFRTRDNILTIKLDYGYGTEKYYYKVTDRTLILSPIDMNR